MPIYYKFDILAALKEKGDNVARICEMLDCQPGDLLYYNKEAAESPCE